MSVTFLKKVQQAHIGTDAEGDAKFLTLNDSGAMKVDIEDLHGVFNGVLRELRKLNAVMSEHTGIDIEDREVEG